MSIKKAGKRIATLLAEHFGQDISDMRDNEYQPGRFTRKVYTFGNDYYSAGSKAPIDSDGILVFVRHFPSSYDPSVTIWEYKA